MRSSILGADRSSPAEFINAHTVSDRYLEDSGLPFVIIRPNLFLQNVPESTIPAIDGSGTFHMDWAKGVEHRVDAPRPEKKAA